MRFANDVPKGRAGWLVTLALAAVLIFVFQTSEAINVPTVVRMHTDKTASSVRACLETAQGKKLFGGLTRVPLTVGRRWGPRDRLYSTAKGHLILITEGDNGETILRLKDAERADASQVRHLSGCADELVMW